ncbi:unnamed protein product, partial [Mesorhabditis spiculigera]
MDHSGHNHAHHNHATAAAPTHDMGHSMAFHFGNMETILFTWWMPNSASGMFWSCFLVFLFCWLYESVKFFRLYRNMRNTLEVALVEPESRFRFSPKITAFALFDVPLHAIQIVLAYALMLIFMTFNVWLCMTIVIGETLSHLFYRICFPYISDVQLSDPSPSTIRYIGFPGELFLNTLKCIILPLIAASLIAGISQLDASSSGKIGSRAFAYYGVSLTHAVILGIILVLLIHPGNPEVKQNAVQRILKRNEPPTPTVEKLLDLLRNMFPENIVQATFAQKQAKIETRTLFLPSGRNVTENILRVRYIDGMNILGVIIFCIAFGVCISIVGEPAKPLSDLFIALDLVIHKMVTAIMWFGPLGIASIICSKLLEVADLVSTVLTLSVFILTVLAGLLIQVLVTLPLIYYVVSRKNPYRFLRGLGQALITGLGTGSSAATMPCTFGCLDRLGVDPRVTKFVLPVGTNINMDGTALYEAVAAIFIAQINGLEMGLGEVVTVAITATLASIGAAAVPSGGLVTLILVVTSLGLPASDVGLVMAVDWLMGRLRCITNIVGDAFACGVVDALVSDTLPPLPIENMDVKVERLIGRIDK